MLFDDTFEVQDVDPGVRKFTRVSRILCHGENYEMDLVLDINSDLFKVKVGDKVNLALASTLRLDGQPDEKTYNPTDDPSLMDHYEYVMHGKVFKIQQSSKQKNSTLECYVSYGGLLMCLKGDPRNLHKLELDQQLYLLMRRVDL